MYLSVCVHFHLVFIKWKKRKSTLYNMHACTLIDRVFSSEFGVWVFSTLIHGVRSCVCLRSIFVNLNLIPICLQLCSIMLMFARACVSIMRVFSSFYFKWNITGLSSCIDTGVYVSVFYFFFILNSFHSLLKCLCIRHANQIAQKCSTKKHVLRMYAK